MITATVGLLGVMVGAFLSHWFATSKEWRTRRMDALVNLTGAAARVTGAHERLHDLIFRTSTVPDIADPRVESAMVERSAAHAEWRRARSAVDILMSDDVGLVNRMDEFERRRAANTLGWIRAYQTQGAQFVPATHASSQHSIWVAFGEDRRQLVTAAQQRVRNDLHILARLRASRAIGRQATGA